MNATASFDTAVRGNQVQVNDNYRLVTTNSGGTAPIVYSPTGTSFNEPGVLGRLHIVSASNSEGSDEVSFRVLGTISIIWQHTTKYLEKRCNLR